MKNKKNQSSVIVMSQSEGDSDCVDELDSQIHYDINSSED
jgi:hypothetical protein